LGGGARHVILVAWFGDLKIISGEWPLVPSSRPFARYDWPVPKFAELDVANPDRGWLVEYDHETDGLSSPLSRTYVSADVLRGLPGGGDLEAGAVEIRLTRLLR
jgi:hypothetical protein